MSDHEEDDGIPFETKPFEKFKPLADRDFERSDKVLESSIEKDCGKYAKKLGFVHRKFSSPGNRSVPDRIYIHPKFPGRLFFIEYKAPGKTFTPAQLSEANLLRTAGTRVFLADTVELGKRILDDMALKFSSTIQNDGMGECTA